MFTRFKSLEFWDIRWENMVVARINNFLNVNITYLYLYEKVQSPIAQMKKSFQLGFAFGILWFLKSEKVVKPKTFEVFSNLEG